MKVIYCFSLGKQKRIMNVKMKIADAFKKLIYSEGVTPLPAAVMAVLYTLLVGIRIPFNSTFQNIIISRKKWRYKELK